MKKLFTVAVLALMMAGGLMSCGDNAAKKRATEFMDALKNEEYLEAAMMIMGFEDKEDMDEFEMENAIDIQQGFKEDFKGGIKEYCIDDGDFDDTTATFIVTITMNDGSEMTAEIAVEKNDDDKWDECAMKSLEQTKGPEKTIKEDGTVDTSFILGDNKLGPLSLGQTVASLPESVEGLYDSYKYDKVEIDNEMEGSWTEEWCYFYKDGKEIFKAFAEGKKLESFVLEEGSSFIQTTDGYYVGSNARDLFTQKPMEWETWYEGTTFARDGRWEYHIASDDLIGVDTPTRVDNIKETAKIVQIVYYKKSPV